MKNTLKSGITLFAFAATLTMSAHVGAVSISLNSATGVWEATVSSAGTSVAGEGTDTIFWPGDDTYGGNQSSYNFKGAAPPPKPVPLGDHIKIGTFTHVNKPIHPPTLKHANLVVDYEFFFDFADDSLDTLIDGQSTFLFKHNETLNNQRPDCENGNGEQNYQGVNYHGCADEVTFELISEESTTFSVAGTPYQLDLAGFLVNGEIVESFFTKEKRHNSAHLMGKLTVVPLPAAAPLFASILGLFGLLRLRSRKSVALSPA